MIKPINNKKNLRKDGLLNKSIGYCLSENPIDFYISEETLSYGDRKTSFTVYYDIQ